MFDVSFSELALVVVVAVVFIGPKELPTVIRAVAKAAAWLKGLSLELRAAWNELSKEAGVAEMRKEFEQEVRMIRGDDGKLYEAFDVDTMNLMKPEQKPHE